VGLVAGLFRADGDAVAHCISVDNSPHVELLRSGSVPTGSALVAYWEPRALSDPFAQEGKKPQEDVKAWKLVMGSDTIVYTWTGIAPGLFIVMPDKPVTGSVEVTDPSTASHKIEFTSEALPALLAAPKVHSIKRKVVKDRRSSKTIAIAKLAIAVPDDAVALVAYVGGVAVAWQSASSGDTELEIFHDQTPCISKPNSAKAPRAGTKVQLAWLDKSGRLSKRSAMISVK